MRVLILLLFSIPVMGQVTPLKWGSEGVVYQDAIIGDTLYFNGRVVNLEVNNYKIITNGVSIKKVGEPINAYGFLQLSKDGNKEYYDLSGRRVRPINNQMYIVKQGKIIRREIYFDDWGFLGAINGGL